MNPRTLALTIVAAALVAGLSVFALRSGTPAEKPATAPGESAEPSGGPGSPGSGNAAAASGPSPARPQALPASATPRLPDGSAADAAPTKAAPEKLSFNPYRARCSVVDGGVNCGACIGDTDCPPGQVCLVDVSTERTVCRPSDCATDRDCGTDAVCRVVNDTNLARPVRRCIDLGRQKLGESCRRAHTVSEDGCARGLICLLGTCVATCEPDGGTGCPAGSGCMPGDDGFACTPSCQDKTCPSGQKCIRVPNGLSWCAEQHGDNCFADKPCPEGQRCISSREGTKMSFSCETVCNPLDPATCPTGSVCGIGVASTSICFKRCKPTDPASCPDGLVCSTVSEDTSVWGCRKLE